MPPAPTTERPRDDAPPDFNAGWLRRLQQLTLVGFGAAILVFVALFALFFYQLNVVRRKVETARGELADKQARLVDLDRQLADRSAQLERTKAALSEVREDVQLSRTDAGPTALATPTPTSANPAIDDPPAKPTPPARIYIQIADDASQLQGANSASARLREKGYVVPDVENVGRARAPNDSQLRFYRTDDPAQSVQAERDTADIINLLRQSGVELKKVPLPPSRNVRPRHYEIWLAGNASSR